MAVDQDLLDQMASTVGDLYRDAEAALIRIIAARLRRELPVPASPAQEEKLAGLGALSRSAQLILAALQAARAGAVRDAIGDAYRHGWTSALADLVEVWFPRSGAGQDARRALDAIPNAATVENIAQALHRDLGRVDGNVLRAPVDAYRAVQAGTAARIATGIVTRREASQAAWQTLIDQGITSFTDRANRRWRLSTYVEMVGRTNIQRAAVQGQTDRLKSIGVDLVIVSDNVQECVVCRPFEGKILAIAGAPGRREVEHATRDGVIVDVDVLATLPQAQAAGLFHPNCRHSISAYTPGITKLPKGTADPAGDEARQRQRALERKIRHAKERALGALTPEAKKQANARVRDAQARLRAHLDAHPNLKRLRYREAIGAGNLPDAGGPKGGPVTPLQPPVQEGLPIGAGPSAPPRPVDPEPSPVPDVGPGQLGIDDITPEPDRREPTRRTVPEDAEPYHRSLDGIEQLVDAVEGGQPPTDTRRLGGSSAQTELVTLSDGTQVIRKSGRAGLADLQDADAEHLTSLVGRALGLDAPSVYRRGEGEIWMEYRDDATTPEEEGAWSTLPERFAQVPDSDQGKRMGLLDVLTQNADRNNGNWMLTDDGTLVPIDHGMSFGEIITPEYDASLEYVNSPFADHYKDPDGNPLTRDDVDEVRRRLESLRPDFDHRDLGHWLDYSLRVLDMLAPGARGGRNLIAGTVAA